tara:strand:+ start:372 stop:506 length:135 start_codon:yes stop_codon:yes gene_type:complete
MTFELIIFILVLLAILKLARYALKLGVDQNNIMKNIEKFDKKEK